MEPSTAPPASSTNVDALHAAARHRHDFHWTPQAISSAAGSPIHTACCAFEVTNSSAANVNTASGAALGGVLAVIHTAAAAINSSPLSAAASM